MNIPPLSKEQMYRALDAANAAVPDLHPIGIFTIPQGQEGDQVSPQLLVPSMRSKHLCETLLGLMTALSLKYEAPWAEDLKAIANKYLNVH